jgi:mediator of RNA polymerase II transcription subunit 5
MHSPAIGSIALIKVCHKVSFFSPFPSFFNYWRFLLTILLYVGLKVKLGQAITSYLPMCVDVSLPLRHRLDTLQKEFNLYGQQPSKQLDNPEIDGMDVNSLQFETSVIDGPIINTRAGLYVYLNSMV